MFPENIGSFVSVVNTLGLIAFAFSGAAAGVKKETDQVGVIILALIACSCGGLVRDILLGDTPPELLRSNFILVLAVVTGLVTYYLHPMLINRLSRPIDFFDALGLGLFAVVGADKAMDFGLGGTWCVGLGLITAVGGGVVRDMMLAQIPSIFKSQIYALPAAIGAFIMVAGRDLAPDWGYFFMALGAVVASGLRLLAIHYDWRLRR